MFLGQARTFGNYYKRRISRIYPTVLAWAVLSCIFFEKEDNIVNILLTGGGWFVSCIMIYYVVLFFVRKALFRYLRLILIFSIVVSIGLYWVFRDELYFDIYGNTYYKWIHYFSFMLQGAILGVMSKQRAIHIANGWFELLKVAGCVVAFYALCAFKNSANYNFCQTLSLLPLLGVTYYVYRICNAEGIKAMYPKKSGFVIRAIGGLCLEVYLVQYSIFTDKLNFLFPLNLLIVFVEILAVAYMLRCFARIWAQTFKDGDYDWKEVFRVV